NPIEIMGALLVAMLHVEPIQPQAVRTRQDLIDGVFRVDSRLIRLAALRRSGIMTVQTIATGQRGPRTTLVPSHLDAAVRVEDVSPIDAIRKDGHGNER